MAHKSSTAATSRPIHGIDRRRRGRHRRNIDLVSSLPDEILQQHIFVFIPTKLAIRTSVLSRRWRHVWSDTPSLSFESSDMLHAASINETLTRYTALKMIKFHLTSSVEHAVPHIDKWIKFAMSRNVENLSLSVGFVSSYKLPDFFYMNSSIKQLNLMFPNSYIIPTCSVMWSSLKKLSLRYCILSDKSIAKILSGCPILESLTLSHCQRLMVLDLSRSLRLRTLEIKCSVEFSRPRQIVAPNIHRLRLQNYKSTYILVDVSSLNEAQVDFFFYLHHKLTLEAYLLQDILKMLHKLKNAEKLIFGCNILQILSLAEVCGLPFPMFKTKSMTLETEIFQYVIPGIERLLQNSPDLKTVNVHASEGNIIPDCYFDNYLDLQGLSPNQCWRSKDGVFWNQSRSNVESKNVASFVELMLKNTKTLDKMVVQLNERYLGFKLKELAPTLSHNNNVSIVLSSLNHTDGMI
ncbi:F-box-like domain superfamily [Arabidopsis suecica]|uniref:F-box-like domain superfamily n=1 Tax=Arabidopsis suecica TaxID=45249 RepID=A0A8T2BL76_ARASU|nr:F-box-like domain superfamily [Arabidopsis suecica]